MGNKNYPGRALRAYYRAMVQRTRGALPIDELPSRIFEENVATRAYIVLNNGARTLAVYRIRPGGVLRRLKRWPKGLETRP
jgi:hypothetical protein